MVGGDERIVTAHDAAVRRTIAWIEDNAAETRMMDAATGRLVRAGGQKAVIATFRHDTSRNLDPQLHTHAVIANMVQGEDGKWRTMANEKLYASKMLIGALYRAELARGLEALGYGTEKTHADGRFEDRRCAPPCHRGVLDTPRGDRGGDGGAGHQRYEDQSPPGGARRPGDPGLTSETSTRKHWRESWRTQAADLRFDVRGIAANAERREAPRAADREALAHAEGLTGSKKTLESAADRAVGWAVAHLSEREAVFSRTNLLTAALAWKPGAVTIGEAEAAVGRLEKGGILHAANLPVPGDSLTTDRAMADERENIALMERGRGRGAAPMRGRAVDKALRNGPLTAGQKEAVKLILSEKDRVVGVQGLCRGAARPPC